MLEDSEICVIDERVSGGTLSTWTAPLLDRVKIIFGGKILTIVVVGASGLGKSTLINNMFGLDIAKAASGKPVTTKATLYRDSGGGIQVLDTVGFIRTDPNQRDAPIDTDSLLDMLEKSTTGKLKTKTQKVHIDLAFYFILRLQPQDESVISKIAAMGIPIVVIIARADLTSDEDNAQIENHICESMKERNVSNFKVVKMKNPPTPKCPDCKKLAVSKTIPKRSQKAWYCPSPDENNCDEFISKNPQLLQQSLHELYAAVSGISESISAKRTKTAETMTPKAITAGPEPESDPAPKAVMVSFEPDYDSNYKSSDEEADHTETKGGLLMGATLKVFQTVSLVEVKRKTTISSYIIASAVTSAIVVGATPIPISDAALLLPIQAVMVVSICRVFGVGIQFDLAGIISLFPLALCGLLLASLLKLIPGVGSLAGGIINASVSGTLTLALGITILFVCRRLLFERLESLDSTGDVHEPVLVLDSAFKSNFKRVFLSLRSFSFTDTATGLREKVYQILITLSKGEDSKLTQDLDGEMEIDEDMESNTKKIFSDINKDEDLSELAGKVPDITKMTEEWKEAEEWKAAQNSESKVQQD